MLKYKWSFIIGLAVLALAAATPWREKIRLGLDLKGGIHLVLRVQSDDAVTELIGVLFLNTAFALLFIGSGTLFRMANTRDAAGSPAQPAATD